MGLLVVIVSSEFGISGNGDVAGLLLPAINNDCTKEMVKMKKTKRDYRQ